MDSRVYREIQANLDTSIEFKTDFKYFSFAPC